MYDLLRLPSNIDQNITYFKHGRCTGTTNVNSKDIIPCTCNKVQKRKLDDKESVDVMTKLIKSSYESGIKYNWKNQRALNPIFHHYTPDILAAYYKSKKDYILCIVVILIVENSIYTRMYLQLINNQKLHINY